MNGRRRFNRTFCSALLAASLEVWAQPGARTRRIGVLSPGANAAAEFEHIAGLMRAFGWIDGRNLSLVPRSADANLDQLRPLVNELAALKVDLLVTVGTEAAQAAKAATTTIPIVMASAGDPVRAGLVASLARPGGNVTGYSYMIPEIPENWLLFCTRCSREPGAFASLSTRSLELRKVAARQERPRIAIARITAASH